jgi:hypothetical protein
VVDLTASGTVLGYGRDQAVALVALSHRRGDDHRRFGGLHQSGTAAITVRAKRVRTVPPGLVIVHLRAVPDDIVLARSQGAEPPAPIDSVSPQQFMKVVLAVQAALRP